MDLIKFIDTHHNGDCTTTYNIEFLKDDIKLSEFLDNVIHDQSSNWWGIITIYYPDPSLEKIQWLSKSDRITSCKVEYKDNQAISGINDLHQLRIYDSLIDEKHKSYANGGWGRMDYIIYVK